MSSSTPEKGEQNGEQKGERRPIDGLDVARFLLELGLLVGLAAAGATVSWVLAVLGPLVLAVLWGLYIAPKSKRRVRDPARLSLEVVLALDVAVAMAKAGWPIPGVLLAVASIAVSLRLRQLRRA